jgi:hypothetical protein
MLLKVSCNVGLHSKPHIGYCRNRLYRRNQKLCPLENIMGFVQLVSLVGLQHIKHIRSQVQRFAQCPQKLEGTLVVSTSSLPSRTSIPGGARGKKNIFSKIPATHAIDCSLCYRTASCTSAPSLDPTGN